MTRDNTSSHWEIRFTDGETFTEKCRNTIGGWANMARRIEERMGGRMHPIGTDGVWWTVEDRTFQTVEVQKL